MAKKDKTHFTAPDRKTIISVNSRNPLLSTEGEGTFKETENQLLKRTLSATPAQRLAWLEEALELAYQAGALPSKAHKNNFVPKNSEKIVIKLRPSYKTFSPAYYR